MLHEDRRVSPFVQELFIRVAGDDPVLQGFVGGFVIKLLNMIGALLVLLWRNPSERSLDGGARVRSRRDARCQLHQPDPTRDNDRRHPPHHGRC